MTLTELDHYRRQIQTRNGPASIIDTGGDDRPAVFVHGLATSAYLWRHVIDRVAGERRCVAIDLPSHGRTPATSEQDLSLPALADFIAGCCDALDLDGFDLVANDTGGAISQIVAVRNADRLNTLTLTDCDTQDNLPPKAFLPTVALARAGLLARIGPRLVKNTLRARSRVYGSGYQDVQVLPEEITKAYLEPLFDTPEAARRFQRYVTSLHARDLRAIEPDLASLQVPTLIVWGTADIFFPLKFAYWLQDKIPGATEVVTVDGGKLFFPDERAPEFTDALRKHWAAHP